jgi:hypothetical protein
MVKNKDEYKLGNYPKKCCICRTPTPLRIMRVTNNVEYIERSVINLGILDMDKCVRYVRSHAKLLNDPTLTEHLSRYNTASAADEGKFSIRTGQYNYSKGCYPEEVVWTGEAFNFGYTLYNILSRRSLTKLKGDKAIKNNIIALINDYNDKITNRYSSDNEYEQEPCCSEACLNMWILRN